MDSYQNSTPKDVVIDIPEDDNANDDECCCSCCDYIMKGVTNWFAPPPYASWCDFGCFRCCEAANNSEHVCIVRLRFISFWLACVCCILMPLFLPAVLGSM
jgi:hypothetical protein